MKNLKIILLICLLVCSIRFAQTPVHSENEGIPNISEKNILIVFSANQWLPGNQLVSSTLLKTLENGGVTPLNINIEHLDKQRNSNPEFLMQYRNFLNNKYKKTEIDLIITIDSFALFFFNREGKDLFKEAPIISITTSEININDYKSRDTLFLTSAYDIKGTIDQALHMLPDTNKIFVVNGSSYSESVSEEKIKKELSELYGNMDIQFLTTLSLPQIKEKLSATLPNTIVLYITYFEDINKKEYIPQMVAADLSKTASVPVFTLYDSLAYTGSLGGSMFSFEEEGKYAGEYALKVLKDEYTITGSISLPPKYIPIYNYQALSRFGIKESLLPVETKLIFKNLSFFEKYKTLVISVASVFVFLISLIVLLIVNISRRKRVESEILDLNNQLEDKVENRTKELQDSNTKYMELFNNMRSSVIVYNVKDEGETFIIEDLNKAAEQIEKIFKKDVVNKDIKECYPIQNDLQKTMKQVWQTGVPQHLGQLFYENDKINGWRDNFYIYRLSQDQIVVVYDDVSEKIEQQRIIDENECLIREAHELEKLRMDFFANISHEFKTPLTIILSMIQVNILLLKDDKETINRKKLINNINIEKQNCFRLLKLIDNLIDSTKLDSKNLQMNMTNFNIVSLVEEVTQSVANYIHNNDLTLIFDTDIEEKIIACDLDKIERIILNLLSNSVKYTDSGGKIYVNITDGEEYITISIEDTGIGIKKEKLDIIFDRFRRVDSSFTRKNEGSGLGLSIVKSLIEMHHGTIRVESIYGEGTKFIIKLPVKVLNNNVTNKEEDHKFLNNTISNRIEKTKIEFSDIYKVVLTSD